MRSIAQPLHYLQKTNDKASYLLVTEASHTASHLGSLKAAYDIIDIIVRFFPKAFFLFGKTKPVRRFDTDPKPSPCTIYNPCTIYKRQTTNLYDELDSVGVLRQSRSPPDTASSSLSDDVVSVGVRRHNRSPPNTAVASLDDDVVSVGVRRQSRSPPDTATSFIVSIRRPAFLTATCSTCRLVRHGIATEEIGGRMFELCCT